MLMISTDCMATTLELFAPGPRPRENATALQKLLSDV